jgi:hypothetical protein
VRPRSGHLSPPVCRPDAGTARLAQARLAARRRAGQGDPAGTRPPAATSAAGAGGVRRREARALLSRVGDIAITTASKALGPLARVSPTATATGSKALGPLEAACRDILAHSVRLTGFAGSPFRGLPSVGLATRIGPDERPRPRLALSVHQDSTAPQTSPADCAPRSLRSLRCSSLARNPHGLASLGT